MTTRRNRRQFDLNDSESSRERVGREEGERKGGERKGGELEMQRRERPREPLSIAKKRRKKEGERDMERRRRGSTRALTYRENSRIELEHDKNSI